jgi:hypothetical protein
MTKLRNFLLVAIALGVLPGSVARAASLSVQFDFSTLVATPGQTVTFSGTVTNLESVVVDLNSCAVFSGALSVDCGPFLINAPFFLNPNETSAAFDMFTVTIDLPFIGTYGPQAPGIFSIFGGLEPSGSSDELLSATPFSLIVAPEPGPAVLLGLTVPLLFVLRRRRAARQA